MNTPTPRTALKATLACDGPVFAAIQAIQAERDQLRAEVERLRSDRDCEKRLRKDSDEFRENAIARAELAEAELATERARLDAVISNSWLVYHCSDSSFAVFSNICADYVSPWLATKRSAIDAAMKEDAK